MLIFASLVNFELTEIIKCQKPYLYLGGIDMVFCKFCLYGCVCISCITPIRLIGGTMHPDTP